MERPRQVKLGQILIRNHLLDEEQLAEALDKQRGSGKSLGRVLIESGLINEAQLTAVLAEQIGIRYVNLGSYPIDPAVATLIDAGLARRYVVIPIDYEDDRLVVAMADPTNVFALDDLRIMTGMEVSPVVATRDEIIGAISRYLPGAEGMDETLDELPLPGEFEAEEEELKEAGEDAPIVRYVNLIVKEAVRDGASDVHVEPGEKDVRIRYRVDGVLHEVRRAPRRIHPGIVSRIKLLANMNLAERRVPQDGRFDTEAGGRTVDLRVASIPTVHGEKIVMRVLDRSINVMTLTELGMEPEPLKDFTESFRRPYGTVIVTGPTGSGKTTTMYAALAELNRREVNIITVEDPVEYQLKGLNQVQVNTKVGLTFAASLRSILRCDPDVLMIGEVRDSESAKMAVESALTGHMVLCTLHTNDAPSAVTRLTEMGVEPFLIASAVDCVASQRLARRLCRRCKQEVTYDREYLERIGFPDFDGDKVTLFRAGPEGCPLCGHTGYRGRIGIFEVLKVDEEIERLVVNMATAHSIARLAKEKGMLNLREAGFKKVLSGETSIEEILRVVM